MVCGTGAGMQGQGALLATKQGPFSASVTEE